MSVKLLEWIDLEHSSTLYMNGVYFARVDPFRGNFHVGFGVRDAPDVTKNTLGDAKIAGEAIALNWLKECNEMES